MKQIPFFVTSTANNEWSQLTAIWNALLGNGTTLVGTGVPCFESSDSRTPNWMTLRSAAVLPEKTSPCELAAAKRLWQFRSAPSCATNNFAFDCNLNCNSCDEINFSDRVRELLRFHFTYCHIDTAWGDLCHRFECFLMVNYRIYLFYFTKM